MTNKVILCVDDEKMILNSLKTQLKGFYGDSFSYETAENGFDALEVIDELVSEGFELVIVISDWLMPGIKGDEFLVRVHNKYSGVIKIMLTGHADSGSIERSRNEASLFKCITKPWSEAELIDTINSGLLYINNTK